MDTPKLSREQLDALAEQIANLSLRIDLTKHALLTHLRQFAAHEGWANSGFVSLPAWLSWRIGISLTTAREYVRVAEALGRMPIVDAAFAAGQLSYAKVRAITRAATPGTEQGLVDIAMHATGSQLDRLCAGYERTRVDPRTSKLGTQPFLRRTTLPNGMVRLEVQLTPEQADVLDAALSVMLAGQDASAEVVGVGEVDESADARREACDEAHESGQPCESGESDESTHAPAEAPCPTDPAARADALVSIAQSFLEHRKRPRGSGYELVLLTTPAQLTASADTPSNTQVGGHLHDGTPVPQHLARMLSCDAARVEVTSDDSGAILNVGRARRTVPSAILRALWLRDGGCRAPGCHRRQHLHAHHVVHWADGGETKLGNLALLCPGHHRLVHEGLLRVELDAGTLVFRNAFGLAIPNVPTPDPECEAMREIRRWLDDVEAVASNSRHYPRWDGARLELGYALEWLHAHPAA